ncbi:MAG: transcription termination factor Rho [Verrucomicrobia bacterium]|nr:transcription termination factor Rho [Verrucomicrobiota bacterium]
MSEEDTTVQASLPPMDPVEGADKPVKNRAPNKTAKKAAHKITEQTEGTEDSSPTPDSGPRPTKKVEDDSFDPGDEVSFSFDPNEVKDPGDPKNPEPATEQAAPESDNQAKHQNGPRHENRKQNFRHDGQRGKHKKDFKKQGKKQHQHPQKKRPQKQAQKRRPLYSIKLPELGNLLQDESISNLADLKFLATEAAGGGEPIKLIDYYQLPVLELVEVVEALGIEITSAPNKRMLFDLLVKHATETKRQLLDTGLLWVTENDGAFIVHEHNNYVPHAQDFFVPDIFIKHYGLRSGHMVDVQVLPQEGDGCGYVVDMIRASGLPPEEIKNIAPFEDLIPYYPTERMILETPVEDLKNQDVSMRVIDALTPIGFGQRGLIVAPPRTGKTILLQGIANALEINNPESYLIVLLIDERPEEVTDFRRMVKGEVIASTFDQAADNHVHVAEMVIEKARRMVEVGRNVIILLDSITRLARSYNTMMPNSGKILSGGVEAGALQKPKRFFGSARNIEGGGSLTIMGTALVETGSKMDEVIFEEFKGTGNMELDLDRALSDKRIFPAINMEKSGTRKEELLYHKDELPRIYALRRAMKGVPGTEAMEMLIARMKKTSNNVEFLMQVNR